ncbi:MAG: UDP-N-acetylmuramoyl-tripeptide--D-alanyl-D-alanine ligase [Thainema sp.]
MVCSASLLQVITVLNACSVHIQDKAVSFRNVTTDTRELKPGDLFVALRGENFDGHQFVDTAIANGAIAAVVEADGDFGDLPVLQVSNTLQAYQAIAHWWRQQFSIPVIAITGSVGKTTTKELIAAVLGTHGMVLKSAANFNNEIGVPKTLLQLGAEHDYAIVEMGMRGRGEIALLSQIAAPDIGVITNVGTAHIGRLGSEHAIAEAKCELLAEMPNSSLAILNHDNDRLIRTSQTVWSGKTVTYGLTGGDLQGQLNEADQTLTVEGVTLPLPLPGEHNALNYLAALAVAKALNLSWQPLAQGVDVDLPSGRAKRHVLSNDIVLLDETYNAGVESMQAALKLLASIDGTRRIAVLGTMKELGEHSVMLHHRVGQWVNDLKLDALMTLADEAEAQAMAEGAAPVSTQQFTNHQDLINALKSEMRQGDRILFKASRAVALDQVVEGILKSEE